MDFSNFWWQATGGPAPFQLGNSLRFRGAQYLSRTPSSNGGSVWTISAWIKTSTKNADFYAFAGNISATGQSVEYDLYGWSSDAPFFYTGNGPGNEFSFYLGQSPNNQKYRDPSAWYHVVWQSSSSNATIFVNGVQRGQATRTQNNSYWNQATNNSIGAYRSPSGAYGGFLDGYMAEVHFVSDQALDPTDFGEFNADGVWVPIDVNLTQAQYGTNGFYLDFSDSNDIGADRSGNGNDFTPTGFELTDTTSTSYDWMADSPTDNYSTFNPLDGFGQSNANLTFSSGGNQGTRSTYFLTSGKWYWEFRQDTPNGTGEHGVADSSQPITGGTAFPGSVARSWGWSAGSGDAIHNNVRTPIGGGASTTGDFFQIALDMDAGNIWWAKNGTWLASGNPATGANPVYSNVTGPVSPMSGVGNSPCEGYSFNFGQKPFQYTPPAGFEPLSTAELPNVAITNPSEHFQTILDTGANILTAAQAKFPNGLWWIKDRANANQHQLVDSVRGGNLALQCPASGQETAYSAPAGNSVAWCWAVPGAAVANNDGTIASQVSANKEAGFSIATYTGNSTAGATIGHGLDVAPKMIIAKERNGNSNWVVYHSDVGNTRHLVLNSNAGAITETGVTSPWGDTDPSSTVFTVGANNATNEGAMPMVAYCWHSVPGYSAFGSYQGNSSTDGPFIALSFRPAFLLIKRADVVDGWFVVDNKRNTYNVCNRYLSPHLDIPEFSNLNTADFLANGFKVRESNNAVNASGGTYIYAAFAEMGFGGANISPAPAR